MHDSMMGHIGMENEPHAAGQDNGFGNDGWVEINSYNSSQHQSPIHEYGSFGFMQQVPHSLPAEPTFTRMAPHPPAHSQQHQLLPLIMPSHPTWPSMLTNPGGYQAPPPVPIPPVTAPVKTSKLPSIHQSTPRKTLTDADRRRMCQYHEENPSVKQTEIGAMFGVERSTVSKVLRQKEKYLFPEDRSLSPVKRAKGKFPDIDRALANWVRNSQKQGLPLTDAAIKEKARFFAATVGNPESHLKANSSSWLEKFKQKNGIGAGGKLFRRASETNISDSGSLAPDSAGASASHSPSGISPSSQDLTSPSPLSGSKSEENMKGDGLDFDFGSGQGYRHSNSQSTTSLSSAFTDPAGSSFSAGATSPDTPFAFSPDTFLPSQQSRMPPQNGSSNNGFQRPRSQTFPMLGIDPSYISPPQSSDALTPKYNTTGTASASALDSPIQEMSQQSFGGLDSTISSPPTLHHRSSASSMHRSSTTDTSVSGLVSPLTQGSSPSSPTQDEARRALDTLLNYFSAAPQGFVDQQEIMTMVKLTDKLKIQQPGTNGSQLPGGLHRIPEQEDMLHQQQQHHELVGKLEHSLTA